MAPVFNRALKAGHVGFVTDTYIRDLFHVYLNKFEFHFLRLHINKTNKYCFFIHNGRVTGIVK